MHNTYINALVKKLFDNKLHTFFVMSIRDNLGIKIMKFKRKRRYYLDTDLYGYSNVDYSKEGQKKLKNLATNSQLSDGVQIHSQTKRVFCISFNDDNEESLKYTYGVWLEAIKFFLMEENHVINIFIKNSE